MLQKDELSKIMKMNIDESYRATIYKYQLAIQMNVMLWTFYD